MKTNDYFYSKLLENNKYDLDTDTCIKNAVNDLINKGTQFTHPGMLLGKIQSGKTKTFLGIIGLAFDNNYKVSIILTKGTKALAKQTYQRLKIDYEYFINDDELLIYVTIGLKRYQFDRFEQCN